MIYLNNLNNKKAPHNEELIFLVAFPRGFEPPAYRLGGDRCYPAELRGHITSIFYPLCHGFVNA